MAKIIDEHNDECKGSPRTTAGDITVMDCIYRFSTTKLTHIPGLHQIDMHGDLSGFYESGREMLSLHHWKEGSAAGYKLEMEKMHLVADICDSCFLQRWQFSKDIVLSNGYSICEYPQGHISRKKGWGPGVKPIDLGEVEYTWSEEIDVLHSMAPTRERMGEESKKSYKLLDSVHIDAGDVAVRQVYFREGVNREGQSREMDTVMVLNWRRGDVV